MLLKMISAAALLLGCAAALVSGPGSVLNAQQMDFRSQAGLYLPTRIAIQHGELQVSQRVGVIVGARLRVVFNERFDVITGVSYIPGYAAFRGAGRLIRVGASSHLLTATTGARYWLLPLPRKLSWEVHTGLGAAFGGQSAYEDLFETSTLSGVLGTTVRYQLGRLVTLRLRIQERLTRVRFDGRDPGNSRSPLRVSFGLTLPFMDSIRAVAL